MKKTISILIFIFIFSFFSINEVDAISCLYRGEYDGQTIDFAVHSYIGQDTVFAVPLQKFTVNGETKETNDYWSTMWDLFSQTLKVKEKKYEVISANDDCYQYMFYKQEAGLFGLFGYNQIYFSNDTTIGKDSDFRLTYLGSYEGTTPSNAILEEMVCTYINSDSSKKAGPSHFSFKIAHDGQGNGTYAIYDDFKKLYENNFSNYLTSAISTNVIDHFSIRIFWNSETGTYSCPEAILIGVDTTAITGGYTYVSNTNLEIGYDVSQMDNYENNTSGLFTYNFNYLYTFVRENSSSYIDYEQAEKYQGEICNYTKEEDLADDSIWYVSLSEYDPPNKSAYYVAWMNETLVHNQKNANTSSLPKNAIYSDCENMPVIYTDCLNIDDCTISNTEFSNKDSSGNERVEKLYTHAYLNSQDSTDAKLGMSIYTGYKYKVLLCELKDRLNVETTQSLLSKTTKLDIYDYQGVLEGSYGINDIDCASWDVSTNYDCTDAVCKENNSYNLEKKILETQSYCNEIYDGYSDNRNNESYKGRMHECVSFKTFYASLVSNGIVRSLSNGCEVFSEDMTEKLTFILDLIKIVGPIAALGLGIIDFVKVLANGDADKEMKTAFKHFGIRVGAAALLFLVPLILAFLMDTFLGNQSGYEQDDPFCSVVDWSEM